MKTTLQSSQLQFTRNGATLVIAAPDAIRLVGCEDHDLREVAIPAVQAVAAFDDQIWVATRDGALIRIDNDGRRIDEHALPADPDGELVATAIGVPAGLWSAREPVTLIDDLGSLVIAPYPSSDAIPIAGRQLARYAAARLMLRSGAVVTLHSAGEIVGGSVVFDGTALAVIAEHPNGRDIVVVARGSDRVLQRFALPPGTARVAPRRGLVVVHDAADRFTVIDLRSARPIGVVVTDDDVVDFAIDPDGKLLAIRRANGEVELASISGPRAAATVLSWGAREHVADAAPLEGAGGEPPEGPAETASEAAAPPVEPAPPPGEASSDALPPLVLDALEPLPVRARLPRETALAELDRELRSVTLWTLRAIAIAWDTRRLGYGNEGHHPYEHEVAALVGANTGFATEYLAAADARLVEHEAALAADPGYRGPATPIAELMAELGLSQRALSVLLVIAAPALHGEVARLYGILENDPARALVDELLVQHILADRVSRHDVAAELNSSAPLVRLGLVEVEPTRPRPFAALEINPVVLSRLRGEPPELGAMLVRHADRGLDALELGPGVLAAAVTALTHATRPARLAVRGSAGSGRRTLLAAFAQLAGRALGVIDATALTRDGGRFGEALGLALRRAHLAGLLPVIHGLDAVVLDQLSGAELAHDALAAHPGPLAVITPAGASPPLAIGHTVIDLPATSETERLAIWQRALDGTGQWLRDVAGLASRYRVGAGVIHRAVVAAAGGDPASPTDDRIEAYLRQTRDLGLARHARRVDRLARWSDLILPPEVMDSLREFVGRVRHRRTVYEQWGMGRVMATSRGLTALFQGQPGTGKTLVAGAVARELGLDLYQVDLSKVMSKWIGETERNLAAIFDSAADGQVILLFDEADSLFAKRTDVRSSNDRYANLEVNYLLQRLDSFDGIAILTTNNGGSIDPAFKRRLSFRLAFPFPDEDTRIELWRAHLPRELPRTGELSFDAIAHKYELSGGYIRNACLRAAFLAAQEEVPLQQHHIERAVALEFADLGKLSTSGRID